MGPRAFSGWCGRLALARAPAAGLARGSAACRASRRHLSRPARWAPWPRAPRMSGNLKLPGPRKGRPALNEGGRRYYQPKDDNLPTKTPSQVLIRSTNRRDKAQVQDPAAIRLVRSSCTLPVRSWHCTCMWLALAQLAAEPISEPLTETPKRRNLRFLG